MSLTDAVLTHTSRTIPHIPTKRDATTEEYTLAAGADLIVARDTEQTERAQKILNTTGGLLLKTFPCTDKRCLVVRRTASLKRWYRLVFPYLIRHDQQVKITDLFERLASHLFFHRDGHSSNMAFDGEGRPIILDVGHVERLPKDCDQRDMDICAARMMLKLCFENIEHLDIWDKRRIAKTHLWTRALSLLSLAPTSEWFAPFLEDPSAANDRLLKRCREQRPKTCDILFECHVYIACLSPETDAWVRPPSANLIWPDLSIQILKKALIRPPRYATSYTDFTTVHRQKVVGVRSTEEAEVQNTCLKAALAQRIGKLVGRGSYGSVFTLMEQDGGPTRFVTKVVPIPDAMSLNIWTKEAELATDIGRLGFGPTVHRHFTCPSNKTGFIVMDRVTTLHALATECYESVDSRPNLFESPVFDSYLHHEGLLQLFARLANLGVVDLGGISSLGVDGDKQFVLHRTFQSRYFDPTVRRDREFAMAVMILGILCTNDLAAARARALKTKLFRTAVKYVLDEPKAEDQWSHTRVIDAIRHLFGSKKQISDMAAEQSTLNADIVTICLYRLRALVYPQID